MNHDTRLCTIEGCERKIVARGWCYRHYDRWRKHGDPMKTLTPTRVVGTPEERFWAKVDASGDCWEWTASKHKDGYGLFRPHSNETMTRAHQFAWTTLVGPVPEGLELDHLCRNPACVNPDHLEPVTHRENMRRTSATTVWVKKAARERTHCPQNHEYSGDNVIMDGGYRKCRTCVNKRQNEYYQRRKMRNEDA